MQHLEFLLLCHKYLRLSGDLYAREARENCLLRDAALMNAVCVPEAIRRGGGWRPELSAVSLFNHRLLTTPFFGEAGMHNPPCSRELGWSQSTRVGPRACVCAPTHVKQFFLPPSSHFSGGLAFLARRGSSQVVVLLLWLKYKEEAWLQVQYKTLKMPRKFSN